MVEYASTRLALLCEMAMNEHSANVMPPTSTTITDGTGHTRNTGASLTSRNTPALTMVDEWSSARGGRGRDHGAEQPRVERHLRGLREAREGQARTPAAPRAPGAGCRICEELEERQRAQLDGA